MRYVLRLRATQQILPLLGFGSVRCTDTRFARIIQCRHHHHRHHRGLRLVADGGGGERDDSNSSPSPQYQFAFTVQTQRPQRAAVGMFSQWLQKGFRGKSSSEEIFELCAEVVPTFEEDVLRLEPRMRIPDWKTDVDGPMWSQWTMKQLSAYTKKIENKDLFFYIRDVVARRYLEEMQRRYKELRTGQTQLGFQVITDPDSVWREMAQKFEERDASFWAKINIYSSSEIRETIRSYLTTLFENENPLWFVVRKEISVARSGSVRIDRYLVGYEPKLKPSATKLKHRLIKEKQARKIATPYDPIDAGIDVE